MSMEPERGLQMAIVCHLHEFGPFSPIRLSSVLGARLTAISVALDRLMQRGLVETAPFSEEWVSTGAWWPGLPSYRLPQTPLQFTAEDAARLLNRKNGYQTRDAIRRLVREGKVRIVGMKRVGYMKTRKTIYELVE